VAELQDGRAVSLLTRLLSLRGQARPGFNVAETIQPVYQLGAASDAYGIGQRPVARGDVLVPVAQLAVYGYANAPTSINAYALRFNLVSNAATAYTVRMEGFSAFTAVFPFVGLVPFADSPDSLSDLQFVGGLTAGAPTGRIVMEGVSATILTLASLPLEFIINPGSALSITFASASTTHRCNVMGRSLPIVTP